MPYLADSKTLDWTKKYKEIAVVLKQKKCDLCYEAKRSETELYTDLCIFRLFLISYDNDSCELSLRSSAELSESKVISVLWDKLPFLKGRYIKKNYSKIKIKCTTFILNGKSVYSKFLLLQTGAYRETQKRRRD